MKWIVIHGTKSDKVTFKKLHSFLRVETTLKHFRSIPPHSMPPIWVNDFYDELRMPPLWRHQRVNSIDMGPSHTSLQAKDDSRPNVTLKCPPAVHAFFFRVTRLYVFGEEGSFLTIRTLPAVIVVFEGESEFPLSLVEELGRSSILRSLYFNGLRNQRVKYYRNEPSVSVV
ncbi:hypothetical protein AVEN_146482-1 [Araneus ventricosus]|uniref:Uncharacterized protein n=1 Tax=Araneus ventricosus TaxID=182803 RepID=A0A4Y2RYL2_ARAVE|nr:hypothetical protein AVEN_146482-1 [Araneus ventricosus]